MRLDELIAGLPIDGDADARPPIADVVEDSRRVIPGALFVARPGSATSGRRFLAEAVAAGAAATLVEPDVDVPALGVPVLRTADVVGMGARLAERRHGDPSRRLELVAITGTNGKTTVAWLVRALLAEVGWRTGLLGTIEMDDGVRRVPAALTTPGAPEVSRTLARMVDNGCRVCVMEASSHALAQRRMAGLRVQGAVFTNLSGDHLDYHGTMEAYAAAKASLFASLPSEGWAIVNSDDPAAAQMIDAAGAATVVTTSLDDDEASAHARVTDSSLDGVEVILSGEWGTMAARIPLVGRHNAMNALQAVAVTHRLGVPVDAIRTALPRLPAPPGRLERVPGPPGRPAVFVDYAHTDDALEKVLAAVRPEVPAGGRLVVVFGCGGDRDRTKRPRMAAVACRYGDRVIVTSDNPRTERPAAIVRDVLAGVPADRRGDTIGIVDRAEAIRTAIADGDAKDLIIIAGKGHEDYQIVGDERRDFDDRRVAAAAFAAMQEPGP
ncbi:MAG: UDP-N-acetylmuramoyl-L-alanyl-D-glutamate--2,6-diaminopimelate ligase [Phycisphaerales bacterium]|nr:UDP-N-acetylmuramoyl-L-alanyl-D-glutamate--2,6-diaminopimelate ligase [Phycisphaerales bacterium]